MTRELFVSSTPHETKVGLVEDDLLAEVYLERENEYTLAGSIYKGRVTRVLPGMQSAFVDIGLERDAFLYVSDFMDLEQQDEDLDEVPTNRPAGEQRSSESRAPARARSEAPEIVESSVESPSVAMPSERFAAPAAVGDNGSATESSGRESRGGFRGRGGRRRRGGRGDRGERSDRGFDARRTRTSEPAAGYE